MEIQITSRHGSKASPTLQETITAELQKMEKYYDKITECHVILDSEKLEKTIEITMHTKGKEIVASASAENIGKAIDEVLEKIERQLKKLNEKIKDHKA